MAERRISSDGLELRAATNADSAAVRELVFSILREFRLAPDPAATDADLDDLRGSYEMRGGRFDVLVTPDGAVVGSIGLYPIDRCTVELRKMYLDRRFRGRGHGRRLLEHALAEARRLGFSRMVLETAAVLKDAVRMYRRYGFRPYEAAHRSCRCDQSLELELNGARAARDSAPPQRPGGDAGFRP